MSLFYEESKEEKQYKELIKAINTSNLDYTVKDYLKKYVIDIRDKKKNNKFFDMEFLSRVIINTLSNEELNSGTIEDYMNTVEKEVNFLLPLGTNTDNYEDKKELIINNYLEIKDLIDYSSSYNKLYSLFSNYNNYIQLIKIIKDNSYLSIKIEEITKYAIKVSPYIQNEKMLVNEIINFMEDMARVDNIELLTNDRLKEAKKRVGIYGIDEKTIAVISKEVDKAERLMLTLKAMEAKVEHYKEITDTLTTEGEKRLREEVQDGSQKLERIIKTKASEILEELDEYLNRIEDTMRANSNKVFQDILEDSSKRIREIKQVAIDIQSSTSQELLRIKRASEEATDKLKDYVENEPKLQELVKASTSSQEVRTALLSLSNPKDTYGYDEVPSTRIITSSPVITIEDGEIEKEILDLYNDKIPFDKRYSLYLKKKKELEKKGEFFHELTDESARCIMENDWLYGYGPSGSGKTKTICQLAEIIGTDIIPNGKITDKYSLMAYNDPHGRFRPTPAYLAVTKGKILLLDEFDNGNPDTQVLLNELYSASLDVLDNPKKARYVYFGENIAVRVHPNFRMVSLGNTSGEGENELFSSRAKIDESVLERMTPKYFDYDDRLEDNIFGEYVSFKEFLRNIRRICDKYAKLQGQDIAQGNITTRDASAIARYIRNNSKSLRQIIYEKIIQTKDVNYLNFLKKEIQKQYNLERCTNPKVSNNLSEIKEINIAKSFVYECVQTIERHK